MSLYNETLDADGHPQAIYPTPVVGMVGRVADVTQVCGLGWRSTGDLIYLLGVPLTESLLTEALPGLTLGGSEYLATLHHTVAGMPPVVDFDLERRVQSLCRRGIAQGWVRSAHDSAEGGLAVALAECCMAGQRGATLHLPISSSAGGALARWDQVLFAEGGSRIVVSVSPDQGDRWEAELNTHLANHWQRVGTVTTPEDPLRLVTMDNLPLINARIEEMGDRWLYAIERRMST